MPKRPSARSCGKSARKIRRIRASIRQNTYENDLKLTIAADRLLQRIGRSTAR
jgi:hypothetical protein